MIRCGDDGVLNSVDNDPTRQEDDKLSVTGIKIFSNEEISLIDDEISFTAYNQDNIDVTNLATFTIDGDEISGSSFTPEFADTFEVQAYVDDVFSEQLTVIAIENITSIQLTSDKGRFKPISHDGINLTALNQDGYDVTRIVTIYQNEENRIDRYFSSELVGDFSFVAKYGNVTSNQVIASAVVEPTSLNLVANTFSIRAINYDKVLLKVLDQDGDDIAQHVNIYAGEILLDQPYFKTLTEGVHIIRAEFGEVKSQEIMIEAYEATIKRVPE